MLTFILPANDDFDAVEVHLEHSLVSLSKWEAIHKKPFYSLEEKTDAENRSYIAQMVRDDNPPEDFEDRLTYEHYQVIWEYVNSTRTATTFRENPNEPKSREIITAELIYYWMIPFQIPFQPCEEWHLSRLMALIRICGIKQTKPTKMTRQQQQEEYKRINAERRAKLGTTG